MKGVLFICNLSNLKSEVEVSGLLVHPGLPTKFQGNMGFIWRLCFKKANKETKENIKM
jgi:hypothetical protein